MKCSPQREPGALTALLGPAWPWLQDYVTYWLHRIYHTPWLYKNFHKLHHKYKHPTAFSVTAIHPVEVLHIQMTLCLPLFAFPCHWGKPTTLSPPKPLG